MLDSSQLSGGAVSNGAQVVFLEVPEYGRRAKFSREGRHATSSAVVSVEQEGDMFHVRTASGSVYSGRLQPGVDAPMFGLGAAIHKSAAGPPPQLEDLLDNKSLVVSSDSGLYSFTIEFRNGRADLTIQGPSGITTVTGKYALTQLP